MLNRGARVRRQKDFDAYTFDEAYSVLLAYTKGEIGVSPFARKAPDREKGAPLPIDDAFFSALIKSIALIGSLAIQRYYAGKTPGGESVRVWKTGLKLAKRLVRMGILQEYGQGGHMIIGGYSFLCRLYFAPCTGVFLMPEQPGKKAGGYFGSFPRWSPQNDTWPIDEALAGGIIVYCAQLI